MSSGSFYKKVLSYLAEVNRGRNKELIEEGWISEEDEYKIIVILSRLGCIEENGESYSVTRKGLNILLNLKRGELGDSFDDGILKKLIARTPIP